VNYLIPVILILFSSNQYRDNVQTIPLYQTFGGDIQLSWTFHKIQGVKLVTESTVAVRGSCCDNGRTQLPSCANW
jgi:hypothetical protein